MAVDIDSFKRDLEQLKNQRSLLVAKRDEAKRHVDELTATLNGMGFATIEDAKAAYVKQVFLAESQHEQVKKLIQEINLVDTNVPTREEVANRLNSLSIGDISVAQEQTKMDPVIENVIPQVNVVNEPPVQVDVVQEDQVQLNIPEGNVQLTNVVQPAMNNGETKLEDLLFASL